VVLREVPSVWDYNSSARKEYVMTKLFSVMAVQWVGKCLYNSLVFY
jgi:hypothetical protein